MIERRGGKGNLVKQAIAATGYMSQSILEKRLMHLSVLLLERQVSSAYAFLEGHQIARAWGGQSRGDSFMLNGNHLVIGRCTKQESKCILFWLPANIQD